MAISRDIVVHYEVWRDFFNKMGIADTPPRKANVMRLFKVVYNLKCIDGTPKDISKEDKKNVGLKNIDIDGNDAAGFKMAVARDVVARYETWEEFFTQDGQRKGTKENDELIARLFELIDARKNSGNMAFIGNIRRWAAQYGFDKDQIKAIVISFVRDELSRGMREGMPDRSVAEVREAILKLMSTMDRIKNPIEDFYGYKLDITNQNGMDIGKLIAWAVSIINKDVMEDKLLVAIGLYTTLWHPRSDRPIEILGGPDISWLAGKKFTIAEIKEFFEDAVYIQSLSRKYLHRDKPLSELVTWIEQYQCDKRSSYGKLFRIFGYAPFLERILIFFGLNDAPLLLTDVPRWKMENTFKNVLAKDHYKAYERGLTPEQEQLRFILGESRHLRRYLGDIGDKEECDVWCQILGPALEEGKGLFNSASAQVVKFRDYLDISASLVEQIRSIIFSGVNYTPEMFKEHFREYVVMRMLTLSSIFHENQNMPSVLKRPRCRPTVCRHIVRMPYGMRAVSPCTTVTSLGSTPSSSAQICESVVSRPWPSDARPV